MKLTRLQILVASLALLVGGCNGAVPPTPAAAPVAAPAPEREPPKTPKIAEPVAAPAATAKGPLRAGVSLDALVVAGLERRSLDVDPFHGEARLVFAIAEGKNLHLSVRVLESAERAREHVTAVGATVARKPSPAQEVGLALPGLARLERGLLGFAAVSLDNVTAVLRVEGSFDEATDRAIRAGLSTFQEAVGEPLAAGTPLPLPKVGAFAPKAPPRAETPNVLRLETDPPCDFVAFEATSGSVLRTKDGPVLYAGEPGVVKVRVAVATRRLLVGTAEVTVEVQAAE